MSFVYDIYLFLGKINIGHGLVLGYSILRFKYYNGFKLLCPVTACVCVCKCAGNGNV